ncbi:MAG: glycosyltransferase [Bacteroidia bacterium]
MALSISVIIPTVAGSNTIQDLIIHLTTSDMGLPPGDYEIIAVVDGGPPFTFPSEVNGIPITITANQRYRGAAGARNTGALLAKGEYLLFLDDDTFPSESALGKIVRDLRQLGPKAAIGITKNQLIYDREYVEKIKKSLVGHFFLNEHKKLYFHTLYPAPATFLCSTAMAMHRSIFFSVGGFKEIPPQRWRRVGLYIGAEDIELSHRLLQEGIQLFFAGGIQFISRERNLLTPKVAFHRRFIEGFGKRILWEQLNEPAHVRFALSRDFPLLHKLLRSKYGLVLGYIAWFFHNVFDLLFRLTHGRLAWHHPLLLGMYAFEYAGIRFAEHKISEGILNQQQWITCADMDTNLSFCDN